MVRSRFSPFSIFEVHLSSPRNASWRFGIMEKEMETTMVHWGYIGAMKNKMGTTIVPWGYIGIMENKMETTIVYWDYIGIMG